MPHAFLPFTQAQPAGPGPAAGGGAGPVLSPLSTIAETYYIEDGGITVTNDGSGQTVTQNGTDHVETTETVITNRDPSTASANTVTLDADEGATVEVTIQDLHINVSNAAVTTTGDGDVVIELDGNSTLTAGDHHAGLQKENGGTLTIKDQDDDGSLTATGGFGSAGIGGSCYGSSSDIKISGNAVVAVAGGTYEQAFGNAYPDVTELSCPAISTIMQAAPPPSRYKNSRSSPPINAMPAKAIRPERPRRRTRSRATAPPTMSTIW